jgi:cytochrome c oxidase subunit II
LSTLQTAGPSAHAIAQVWWWMLGVACVVLLGVMMAWLTALRRQHPLQGQAARKATQRWLIGGGIVLPVTAVCALLVLGTPAGVHQLPWPAAREPAVHVYVKGFQWRWETAYPNTNVVLTNELRIPAGAPVLVRTQSADVIHSFWVPQLAGKLDAIPGRTLSLHLQADTPGIYRAQCAEFCGTGHAHMHMTVHAMEPAAFTAWLAQQQGRTVMQRKETP